MLYIVGYWIPLSAHKRLPRLGGVYVIRNIISGKEYVGKSINIYKRVDMHIRMLDPVKILYRSMRKNGIDCFECCVVQLSKSDEELCNLEITTIALRNTLHPAGYNLTLGGDGTSGYKHTAEETQRIRDRMLGFKHSPETKAKLSLYRKSTKWSEEHKLRIGAGGTGRKHTEVTKEKMRIWNTGRKHTEATLLKMTAFQLTRGSSSEATKAKVSASLLGNSRRSKEVLVWEQDAMTPKVFNSAREASKYLGTCDASISNWLRGKSCSIPNIAVTHT